MGEITVTEHEGYLHIHFVGAFDDTSLYQAVREHWTADDYQSTHNELGDFRNADLSQLTGDGLRTSHGTQPATQLRATTTFDCVVG